MERRLRYYEWVQENGYVYVPPWLRHVWLQDIRLLSLYFLQPTHWETLCDQPSLQHSRWVNYFGFDYELFTKYWTIEVEREAFFRLRELNREGFRMADYIAHRYIDGFALLGLQRFRRREAERANLKNRWRHELEE